MFSPNNEPVIAVISSVLSSESVVALLDIIPSGGTLVAVVIAALSGGGFASILRAFADRRKVRADAAASLTAGAVALIQQMQIALDAAQADAAEAQKTSKEAREEGNEALRQMAQIRREAEVLAHRLRRLTAAILDDNVSREELKMMVRPATPIEGGFS
jgi:hypothetical protein